MRNTIVILLIFLASAPTVLAQAEEVTAFSQRVEKSIGRGIEFLTAAQNPDGSFGKTVNLWVRNIYTSGLGIKGDGDLIDPDGGRTAICALALLSCGMNQSDPVIEKAMKYIRSKKTEMTYPLSFRIALYTEFGKAYRDPMWADARLLLQNRMMEKPNIGRFTYGPPKQGGVMWTGRNADASNSQYGVLGLWYASIAGFPVSRDFWASVEKGWLDTQQPDGGWGYFTNEASCASMTTAGITSLFIAQDYIRLQDAIALNRPPANDGLSRAMTWLEDHFAVDYNVGKDGPPTPGTRPDPAWTSFVYYMLFGYERVGEASGLTRFGKHEWYPEGAEFLMRSQRENGSWKGTFEEPEETAFGLLFLSRGRSPVVIQKMRYDGHWNNRPRDVARAIRWLRVQMERHVNWQIVSVDAPMQELSLSPVLYTAGDMPMDFNDAQKKQIRDYIDRGGLWLCVNEGQTLAFADSIKELGKKLYPQYSFRELPPDHAFFKSNYHVKDLQSPIISMSNGVREMIVLIPEGDLSARWYSSVAAVETSKESPYVVLGNIVPYANGRTNPRFKTDIQYPVLNTDIDPVRRINIARIQHDKNWNPEPYAWDRQAIYMHNQSQYQLNVENIRLGTDVLSKKFRIAHLTTTEAIDPPIEQQRALREYVENGGTLLVDVAGGSTEVPKSIEDLLVRTFPGGVLEPLPVNHPIYTGRDIDGKKIDPVLYRRYTEEHLPRTKIGRLKAMTLDNRIIVIYSAEDLTFGMTGALTDGVIGYTPETAADLVRNIILFVSKLKPATKPN